MRFLIYELSSESNDDNDTCSDAPRIVQFKRRNVRITRNDELKVDNRNEPLIALWVFFRYSATDLSKLYVNSSRTSRPRIVGGECVKSRAFSARDNTARQVRGKIWLFSFSETTKTREGGKRGMKTGVGKAREEESAGEEKGMDATA